MALGMAIRVFFRILRDGEFAQRVQQAEKPATEAALTPLSVTPPAPVSTPAVTPPARSEALNLLAALQREARLIDFIQEPIAAYTDAQIGAAVRDIHRDCATALQRMFALRPVMQQAEGSSVEVADGGDLARVRLTGNVSGQPPYRGVLRHGGWQASKVELPEWNGSAQAAMVVAAAEVEMS